MYPTLCSAHTIRIICHIFFVSLIFFNSVHSYLSFLLSFVSFHAASYSSVLRSACLVVVGFSDSFFFYRQIIQMENSPPLQCVSCCCYCCCYHHHHRLASSYSRRLYNNMHSENGECWIVCLMLGLKTCGWWFCDVWLNVRSENHQLE